MLPFLDQGFPRGIALGKSQRRCLPTARHRDQRSLTHTAAPSGAALNKYLEWARGLTEQERAQGTVPAPVRKPAPPRKKLDEGRDYTGNIRWTTLEKAKIVRMVKWFQEHGVTSSLGRMMVEAQELVLPRERRRAVAGIMQGNHGGQNVRMFAEGEGNLWLLKDVPFNPPLPPGSEAAAETEEAEPAEQAQEGTESVQIGPIETGLVRTQPDDIAPPEIPRFAEGGLRQGMAAGLQAFATTMTGALDSLLMSHAALVVHTLDAKIAEQANRMGQELAALIASKLQTTVRGIMEQELGGPLGGSAAAPAPASATATATPVYAPKPAPAPAPEQPKPPRQLKVDVVGLNTPAMEQLVKAAFNGETDIRFFDPDSSGSYAPHRGRECIMLTHRIPHALKDKIRAAKVEPLYVKPTPGHVIHAIEELLRAQTVAHAAHQH